MIKETRHFLHQCNPSCFCRCYFSRHWPKQCSLDCEQTYTQFLVPHIETWSMGRIKWNHFSWGSRLKQAPHPKVYICKLFFHARLLDRPRHRQGCCPSLYRGSWFITGGPGISLHSTSTHIWERITTVSSWNATAVASPMSRPRKTAAKKVATHITCNEPVDGNITGMSTTWVRSSGWEQEQISDLAQDVHLLLERDFFLVKEGQSHQPTPGSVSRNDNF